MGGYAERLDEVIPVPQDETTTTLDSADSGVNGATPGAIPADRTADQDGSAIAPITKQRIDGCLASATHWADQLPVFANRMQRLADRYAILAAILSAITGLAAWGAIAQSGSGWARGLAALVGLTAAVVGIVPRVKNYAEAASKSRELASQYGSIKGRLLDAQAWLGHGASDVVLRQLVADFESVKKSKDLLVPYPAEAQAARNEQKAAAQGLPVAVSGDASRGTAPVRRWKRGRITRA